MRIDFSMTSYVLMYLRLNAPCTLIPLIHLVGDTLRWMYLITFLKLKMPSSFVNITFLLALSNANMFLNLPYYFHSSWISSRQMLMPQLCCSSTRNFVFTAVEGHKWGHFNGGLVTIVVRNSTEGKLFPRFPWNSRTHTFSMSSKIWFTYSVGSFVS